MPWRLPDDLRRFRAMTMGGALIMGRRTFDSIGRPLEGRTSIVLTTRSDPLPEGVVRVRGVAEALEAAALAAPPGGRFVIGGAQIYRLFLPHGDRLELTLVDAEPPADTFFPPIDAASWECVAHRHVDGAPGYSFHTLVRRAAPGRPTTCVAGLDDR